MKGILLFLMVFALKAQAQNSPLYKTAIMPGGPFEGQALDTTHIRGLLVMDGKNISLPEEMVPGYVYIANVVHEGKFFIARIGKKSPQKVSFIYEKFTDMAGGHADLVYELDIFNPLELIYEIKDTETQKGFELVKLEMPIPLTEILLTAELIKAVGDNTGLKEGGLNNSFTLVYRMTSIPERLIPTVIGEGRQTTVFDISFDKKATQASFFDTIEQQSKIGMSKNYHLISNSCITSALIGLSNGLSAAEKLALQMELSRSMKKIRALSRLDIPEAELKKMMAEYSQLLGKSGIQITSESIHKKPYFQKWLNEEQRKQSEALQSKMCPKGLFK